jgi:hypothetical protein
MQELIDKGCTFASFLQAQIGECPESCKEGLTSASTRAPSAADFSLADREEKLELLVLITRGFVDSAAAEVVQKLQSVQLDPAERWILTLFGSFHPIFTEKYRSPMTYGEMDTMDLVRNILLRPALFGLHLWHALDKSGHLSDPESTFFTEGDRTTSEKENPRPLFEILQEGESTVEFTIGASKKLTMPKAPDEDPDEGQTSGYCVPDCMGRIFEPPRRIGMTVKSAYFPNALSNLSGEEKDQIHGKNFIVIELKTPTSYDEMEYLERLFKEGNDDEGSDGKFYLAFDWPDDHDQITSVRDKIICQVSSSSLPQ